MARLFQNDQEFGHFQRFVNETAQQLTGVVESDLWSRLVPQTCEAEPCIRHAVIAIGALDFKTPNLAYGSFSGNQEFAYQQYGLAIAELRKANQEGRADIRTKLIACLLFACFEFYHGNSDLASSQVLAGVEMLRDYAKFRHGDPVHQSTSRVLPKLAAPPIHEDIVETLSVLEISSCAYNDLRSPRMHFERALADQDIIDNIPSAFKSLKEARRALPAVMLRAIHYLLGCSKAKESEFPCLFGSWHEAEVSYIQLCKHFAEFRKWRQAFEPLMAKARTLEGKHLWYNATYQEIHYLSCYLWIAMAAPTEMYWDRYTRELITIVRLAKALIEPPKNYLATISNPTTSYSLDIRLVMPLNLVGMNYHHRALRREVIEICKRLKPRRDGVWDAAMLWRAMEWIADLEDEGLEEMGEGDSEYVPYKYAARWVSRAIDNRSKTAALAVQLPNKVDPTQFDRKEITISW